MKKFFIPDKYYFSFKGDYHGPFETQEKALNSAISFMTNNHPFFLIWQCIKGRNLNLIGGTELIGGDDENNISPSSYSLSA